MPPKTSHPSAPLARRADGPPYIGGGSSGDNEAPARLNRAGRRAASRSDVRRPAARAACRYAARASALALGITGLAAAPAVADTNSLLGGVVGTVTSPITTITSPTPAVQTNPSYWILGSQGGVGAYDGTTFAGSMASKQLNSPVVGGASTFDGKGYWLVASDGGIFSFGDATFFGSMGGKHLAAPIVGMARTADGKGYWLVASDGGIFSFGDAVFHGSMGGSRLAKPVVGMAATPGGSGYWLVASDGGIFAFNAPFLGSMGGKALTQPMVGMSSTADGKGYWTVASDGGIFTFGDAGFLGSMGGKHLNSPVVGMTAMPGGGGYWLIASDGGIFSFGNAPFRGSAYGYVPLGEWISSMIEGPGTGASGEQGDFSTLIVAGGAPYGHAATGYDISWPQCGGAYPPASNVAVVGVNGGSAFTTNPCFGSEAAWGGPNLTVYLNLNSPQGSNSAQWASGPAGTCAVGDLNCESYNFGYNTATSSIGTAQAAGHGTTTWWLDIETGNYWTSDTAANDQVIAGALAAIRHGGYASAIYSTGYQWGQIAGNYVPSVPVWYPTGVATASPGSWCSSSSFAGGPVYLVQSAAGSYDGDYSC